MDAWNRDILALSKNIEIFKRNEDNLRNENGQLKDLVMQIEGRRIDMCTKYELSQSEIKSLLDENRRLKSLIESKGEASRVVSFQSPVKDYQ